MENTPYLYDTLVQVLRQHRNWLDLRHLKTLVWMMVGLIHTGSISLCAWTPYVVSRAWYSQSTVRRFRRWLDNDRIEVHALYGPLMQQALIGWVDKTLYVALVPCGIHTAASSKRSVRASQQHNAPRQTGEVIAVATFRFRCWGMPTA